MLVLFLEIKILNSNYFRGENNDQINIILRGQNLKTNYFLVVKILMCIEQIFSKSEVCLTNVMSAGSGHCFIDFICYFGCLFFLVLLFCSVLFWLALLSLAF